MGTVILRIGIIILGVFLLSVTFSNYVRGKLREKATFLWGILAIAMILSGAVPVLSGWSKRCDIHCTICYNYSICMYYVLYNKRNFGFEKKKSGAGNACFFIESGE